MGLAFAQQPLELGVRGGLPMALVLDGHGVEVQAPRQPLDEHQPGTARVLGLKLPDDIRRPKSFVVFRQGHFQGRRDLFQVMRLPAEHGLREPPEIPNLWNYLLVLVFWQVSQKTLMVHGAVRPTCAWAASNAGMETTRPTGCTKPSHSR